jgi:anti-sigma28 factor (negative regulator of flagellin synthesis)
MGSVACSNNRESGSSIAAEEQEPAFRVEKVLDIKRQLAEGRYDIAEKLGVVVARLLEDLSKARRQQRDQ